MQVLCELTDKLCNYCTNKSYNYGFFSGRAGYCKEIKKWIGDITECPIKIQAKVIKEGKK